MKVLPFQIPKTGKSELIFQEDRGERLYNQLHEHKEIQISLMVKGEGELLVGEGYSRYKSGDIICIGSNVPHLFRSDVSRLDFSYMISLFFTRESFGAHFFELKEMNELNSFFKKIETGIMLQGDTKLLSERISALKSATIFNRFLLFLGILKELNLSDYRNLSSYSSIKGMTEKEGKRMNKVMEYTFSNYQTEVDLTSIAGVANLSPNSFCRYFKNRTNKSYFQFLIEVRIENACRLLEQNPDLSIIEIADRTGFKNRSNFNRKFKQLKKMSPKKFRELN